VVDNQDDRGGDGEFNLGIFNPPQSESLHHPLYPVFSASKPSSFKQSGQVDQTLLNESAIDSLNFLIYLLDLDPSCSVYRFLDFWPTKKVFPFSDASGWEISPKNPMPGCLGGFFVDNRSGVSFAFSIQWQEILLLLPQECRANFDTPHINYLETFAAFILVVWLVVLFPKLVYRKRIILKLDSQVSQSWYSKKRCPSFPVHRLIQTLAVLEWKYSCVIQPAWVKSASNPADKLTRLNSNARERISLKLPNGSSCSVSPTSIPPKVMSLFVDSLLGRVNYVKLFGKEALNVAFHRQARFTKNVYPTPNKTESS
jgi:hypothetical protein